MKTTTIKDYVLSKNKSVALFDMGYEIRKITDCGLMEYRPNRYWIQIDQRGRVTDLPGSKTIFLVDEGVAMKKYEYKTTLVPHLDVLRNVLNEMDNQGYEFVGQVMEWIRIDGGVRFEPLSRLVFRRSVDNEFYSDCSFKNYGKGVSK